MKNRTIVSAIILALLTLSACQTPRQVAQRKLRKALRIDPTVITTLDKDTAIMRQLRVPYVVKVPAVARETQAFNIDSLVNALKSGAGTWNTSGPQKEPEQYLYKDSVASISILKKPDGKVAVAFNVAPKLIHDTLTITDTVKIKVAARVVNLEVKAPAWKYFWFWGMAVALILGAILYFRLRRTCRDDEGGAAPLKNGER